MKQGYYGLRYFLLTCFWGGVPLGMLSADATPDQPEFADMGADCPSPKRLRTQSPTPPGSEASEDAPGDISFHSLSLQQINDYFIHLLRDLNLVTIRRESLFSDLYTDNHHIQEALRRAQLYAAPMDPLLPDDEKSLVQQQLSMAEATLEDTLHTLRQALHHIATLIDLFATSVQSINPILEALDRARYAIAFKDLSQADTPAQIEEHLEVYGSLHMKLRHHKGVLQIKENHLHHDSASIQAALNRVEQHPEF